jgi:recombination protein RecA
MFGNPETTTGGNALKFYSSVRLEIRKITNLKEQEKIIGNQVRVKVVKNKLAPPFKQVECNIIYGLGISRLDEIVDLSLSCDLIQKSGSWYSYNGENIGQGRDVVREYLKNDSKIVQDLEYQIRSKMLPDCSKDFSDTVLEVVEA